MTQFRALRLSADEAEVTVQVLLVVLRDFPAWAIKEGCRRITGNEAGLDRRWSPNDTEIHSVVAEVVRPYGRRALDNVTALLAASVEELEPRRLTEAEIEAKLGRPLSSGRKPENPPPPYYGDGKHAARVAADLEARRRRREAEGPPPPDCDG
jgi:hypothetical protein